MVEKPDEYCWSSNGGNAYEASMQSDRNAIHGLGERSQATGKALPGKF